MDIQTFTLFVAFLLFASLNLFANIKSRNGWLDWLTLALALAGMAGAAYTLVTSLAAYMA